MVGCWGRVARRMSRALAGALVVSAVAGCGGGGGGGSAGVPTSPQGPGAESARLFADFVAQDSNNQFVRVWDPAQPGTAIQNVRITESNGIVWTGPRLVYSDATSYDATTRTVRTLGHTKVFYENDGKVYSIDLRGGQSHVPMQLSSAIDVHDLVRAIPLGADGVDAWIDAKSDGGHDWAIRSTMGATDAPQTMLQMWPMRDAATGLPQYLFVMFGGESGTNVQPHTFGVRDLGFGAVSVPEVEAMGGFDTWMAADPAQPGLAYLAVASQVRALHWSAAGVGVDAASLHDFAALAWSQVVTADAAAVYFADGTDAFVVAGGAVAKLGSFGSTPDALMDAGGVLVAREPVPLVPTCCAMYETLSKADGSVALAASGNTTVRFAGGSAAGLLFTGLTVNLGPVSTTDPGYELLDAHGKVLATAGGMAAGLVRSAVARLDQPAAPVAMLRCAEDEALVQCAAGALDQVDIATGQVTTLGTLAAGSQALQGDLVDGLQGLLAGQTLLATPGGFGGDEVDQRDSLQVTPGVGGSLVRVTSYVP